MTPEQIERIEKLIEAGEVCNQDTWHVVGLPWNNHNPYINTESEDPHLGRAIIDVIDSDFIEGRDDEDTARQEQELEAEMYANMEFVASAANTRADIKALLDGYREMRGALSAIKIQAEFFTQDGIGENVRQKTLQQIDIITTQALGGNDE